MVKTYTIKINHYNILLNELEDMFKNQLKNIIIQWLHKIKNK